MTSAAPTVAGRVLLLTSDDEPIGTVESELRAAGYEIRRCVDVGAATPYPCNGLHDGCPLDTDGGVDVALDVRNHPWPAPTANEMGVVCALRSRVPVAVLSERFDHPFRDEVATTADRLADPVDACERAIAIGLDEARRRMVEAVRSVCAVHGIDATPVSVTLGKRRGKIRATITLDAPDAVRGMAATRAAAALRRVDSSATSVEIEVVAPT